MAANEGWLATTLRVMHLVQMCVQGRWISGSSILTLPHLKESQVCSLGQALKKSPLAHAVDIKEAMHLPELLTLYQRDEAFVSSVILRLIKSQQQSEQVSF